MKIRVKNMISDSGNAIPNQFEIYLKGDYYFQSYDTIIAKLEIVKNKGRQIILDNHSLNYSRTTSKYLFRFLNMKRKEIEEGLKSGEIKLRNLNY
tara:strand:- start:963 stop:1247 length:285 start_codon:yes stop_codon:yes gene_type:complete